MDPWYKITTLRKEVREGRSFNPDEFAIALEQVVSGKAPEDYQNPAQFFSRTCFTRALREHVGLALRRLSGKTENTAPVLTLITQFGGGKTHTLTTLYHLANNGNKAKEYLGILELLKEAGLTDVPKAKVGVFVGNAWDPQEGKETPWIDLARQIAGEKGVAALGNTAKTTPPGTDALRKVFEEANGPVLLLFDEVLNFLNRHRGMADSFFSFFDNVNRAVTQAQSCAAVISLPRSQVEMTDWDMQWQEKITKVVRRVARDLIVNDEAEIGQVVCRRLFEDQGNEKVRKAVAKEYADWCFDHRAELPPEWTAVDTAATESKSREFLRERFEACYPFHPATLSVFQRKWQALSQFQQTRGTLAMLAQWISIAAKDGFQKARKESLITLGSAPLYDPNFRSVVLGQLGESRLLSAMETDIAGEHSHSKVLDVDTKGPLRDIHTRVGTAILFESSGGQTDKVAHLPELRFALSDPTVDTTSVDTAAFALEDKAYFIRRIGTDGFQIKHQPTLRKVVNDRRASLDEESEIRPAIRKMVEEEFRRGSVMQLVPFPIDGTEVPDSPKLTLVVANPELEWTGSGMAREQIGEWTKQRGKSPRLYPGSLVWCLRKPGRELRDKVELWLAWKRVSQEVLSGTLGGDFERSDRSDIQVRISTAESAAKDEVWGGYRYVVIYDPRETDGLKVTDLGAGHSSGSESLCGRIIFALKSSAILNESVGAGYIDRNWPPALKEAGAWPLASLRQSFLNGSLTRLLDPDATLRGKIVEFVGRGDFGLASGKKNGGYERVWFSELMLPEEVAFENNVFLLTKDKAQSLKANPKTETEVSISYESTQTTVVLSPVPEGVTSIKAELGQKTIRLFGTVPPEVWNRIGTKIIPKLRSGSDLQVGIQFSVTIPNGMTQGLESELRVILKELNLEDEIRIDIG